MNKRIRFIPVFLILILPPALVKAQWTINGSSLYNTNSGNIGVGTVNPLYKLDIFKAGSGSGLNIAGQAFGTRNDTGLDFSAINGTMVNYAKIGLQILTATAGQETGGLTFSTISNGAVAEKMFIAGSGNIGIGTVSPAYKLDIFKSSPGAGLNVTGQALGTRNDTGIDFSAKNGETVNYAKIGLQVSTGTVGQETGGLTFSTINGGRLAERMFIDGYGNVAIGTINPSGYKLAVSGNVIAEAVTVKLATNWPDYVFKQDYKLPTLTDIRKQIKQNGHLPGIPSAKDIQDNGINLGELNAKLLEKIEELTLHLIDQDKRLQRQEELIKGLSKINYKKRRTK